MTTTRSLHDAARPPPYFDMQGYQSMSEEGMNCLLSALDRAHVPEPWQGVYIPVSTRFFTVAPCFTAKSICVIQPTCKQQTAAKLTASRCMQPNNVRSSSDLQ